MDQGNVKHSKFTQYNNAVNDAYNYVEKWSLETGSALIVIDSILGKHNFTMQFMMPIMM